MRRIAAAWSAVLLVGCAPVQVPVGAPADFEPPGPTLVFDVTNESAAEPILGFEYEGPGQNGVGELLLTACRRETQLFGSVGGDYRLTVDGEMVAEGTVPAGARDDAWFLFRLRISPNGEVELAPPVLVVEQPAASVAIPGCG